MIWKSRVRLDVFASSRLIHPGSARSYTASKLASVFLAFALAASLSETRSKLALRNMPRFSRSPSLCSASCAGSGESFNAFTQFVQMLMCPVSNWSGTLSRLQIWQVPTRCNLRATSQKLVERASKLPSPKTHALPSNTQFRRSRSCNDRPERPLRQ